MGYLFVLVWNIGFLCHVVANLSALVDFPLFSAITCIYIEGRMFEIDY